MLLFLQGDHYKFKTQEMELAPGFKIVKNNVFLLPKLCPLS